MCPSRANKEARHRLIQAEMTRRQGDLESCLQHLTAAAGWILHSGSVEHLCLWHLIQARVARAKGEPIAAQNAVDEGLALARRCGLGLSYIELLCEQAEQFLVVGDWLGAETAAGEALQRAKAPDCQFLWGAAEAGHLLGEALAARDELSTAGAILRETLDLRRCLGDPKTRQTEKLLERLKK